VVVSDALPAERLAVPSTVEPE
jgi:hypothetical protein